MIENTDEIATISPANSPFPPIACAIGAEDIAVGDPKTAKSAINTSPLIPKGMAVESMSVGAKINLPTTAIARYFR